MQMSDLFIFPYLYININKHNEFPTILSAVLTFHQDFLLEL